MRLFQHDVIPPLSWPYARWTLSEEGGNSPVLRMSPTACHRRRRFTTVDCSVDESFAASRTSLGGRDDRGNDSIHTWIGRR